MVDDNAPGVPVDARTRLFEPFASLDPSRSKALGRIKLGLGIAPRAANRWDYTVVVEDSPLGRARFAMRRSTTP